MTATTPRPAVGGMGRRAAAMLIAAIAVAALPEPVANAVGSGAGLTTRTLPVTVSNAFADWLSHADATPPAALRAAVTMWLAFHVAKAALAIAWAALAGATLRLATRRWVHAAAARERALYGALAVASTAALALAGILTLANVQGAVAPLSSLISMLPATPTPAMADAAALVNDHPDSPVAAALIADFRAYHLAMVWTAVVALGALGVGAARLARTGDRHIPRERALRLAGSIACGVGAAAMALLMVANASTSTHPAPALAAFLTGSA